MGYSVQELAELGITNVKHGQNKIKCPRCSHNRKHKHDKCLSVRVNSDVVIYNCHNCGFSGHVGSSKKKYSQHLPKYQKPAYASFKPDNDILTDEHRKYLNQRIISDATIDKAKLYSYKGAIAFPYYDEFGNIANVKSRTLDKKFYQKPNARSLYYMLGSLLDAIDNGTKEVIITEGEIDALSFNETGLANVVSIPSGAVSSVSNEPIDKDRDTKFSYVHDSYELFEGFDKIYLAMDSDKSGQANLEELARRYGKHKCWIVEYPSDCKDANDVLVKHGQNKLLDCIQYAKPYPLETLHPVTDYGDKVLHLYRYGYENVYSTGFKNLDPYFKIRPGELTIVTGYPNMGKSEFLDAILVNMAKFHGWSFGLCSFENPPEEHIAKLVEKHLKQPFRKGFNKQMDEEELIDGIGWVNEHFCLIRSGSYGDMITIDVVLDAAKAAIIRYGIKGLVIDPYNELEHNKNGESETDYISKLLTKVKGFAQNYGIHVFFVAHPAKPYRNSNGEIPSPGLYDISGSANWANKADVGLVVHRPRMGGDDDITQVIICKCRHKAVGKQGRANFKFHIGTGEYEITYENQQNYGVK